MGEICDRFVRNIAGATLHDEFMRYADEAARSGTTHVYIGSADRCVGQGLQSIVMDDVLPGDAAFYRNQYYQWPCRSWQLENGDLRLLLPL